MSALFEMHYFVNSITFVVSAMLQKRSDHSEPKHIDMLAVMMAVLECLNAKYLQKASL